MIERWTTSQSAGCSVSLAVDAAFGDDLGDEVGDAHREALGHEWRRLLLDDRHLELGLERLEHPDAIIGVLHIDEIDDYYTAYVAQSKLPDHLDGGLQVRL